MELADVLINVTADITADVAADITTDIIADVANRTELKARVKIRQPKELKIFNSLRLSIILLLAVRYWDSLKS